MKDSELVGKVHSSVYHQCQRRGYAAPVDVLMDIGVLSKQRYEDWRYGKVDYLERVCNCNLKQLSFIMKQIRAYSAKAGYQGNRMKKILKRVKINPEIERAYATHYVDAAKCEELKKNRAEAPVAHE